MLERPIKRRRLKLGDYVVHTEHGIARFGGVTTMSINGSEKEYLVLLYDDGKASSMSPPTRYAVSTAIKVTNRP